MKKFFLMLALASPMFFGFAMSHESGSELSCPAPTNVSVVSKSGGNIAFDWSDCTGGCSQYLVRYYRLGDSYQSQVFTTSVSAISFSGLPSGTYRFSFATDCGGTASGYIIVEESIMN